MYPEATDHGVKRRILIATRMRRLWAVLALAMVLLCALAGCQTSLDEETTQVVQSEPLVQRVMGGFSFTPQQTSSIIGNAMHETHNETAKIECVSCHQDPAEFLTHEKALALCLDCHDSQIVALPVWENHCLSCHQFTNFKEKYADSSHILRELCQDCHGLESVFYRAFDPESPHDVTCDNCHHPHLSAVVVSEGLCDQCHPDIVGSTSPENKVHGSCIVCHTPHSERPKSDVLCGKCHIATSDVLVHNVPEHPSNCLACHDAHFTEVEITSSACLVCHDDTFYGGRSNLPRAHRNCESCHYTSNFRYKGDEECAACHESAAAMLDLTQLPDQHRTCVTCHEPHSWYTKFEHNCDRCHDVDAVIEHRLSFHQATCHDCHDPHHTELMSKSGYCDGCHGEGTFPNFRAGLDDMHLQCNNCHSAVAIDSREFDFIGARKSCLVCHTEADPEVGKEWDAVPAGHHICQACHFAHTFDTEPGDMNCSLCHRDVFSDFPSKEHGECFNCHEAAHAAGFTGQETSCDICHAEESALAPSEMKRNCELCHEPHEFTADPAACSICHSDVSGLHSQHAMAGCTDCHGLHSWKADLETCRMCHTELPADCTSDACTECHAF